MERVADRAALLVRLRNTVPKKMATVTQRTPKFPQKIPLQPVPSSGAESNNDVRSDNIHPPAGIRHHAIPRPKPHIRGVTM